MIKLITGFIKVLQSINNRKSCTNICLIKEAAVHLVCSVSKLVIELNVHRVSALVRSCNAHTRIKDIQIALRQIIRSSTVNKNRIKRLLLANKLNDIINILI